MPELEIVTTYDPAWPAAGTAAKQAALADALRRLHQAILTYFLGHGGPPGQPWLCDEAIRHGLDPQAAYAELAAADLVHLDDAGRLRAAYPFSGTPSGHRVHLDGAPPVWAMCAIDALGIPQMAGRDGVITAADPHGGDRVHVQVTGGRWHWSPQSTAVLAVFASTGAPAAQCACPHVNFVTSPDHARAYLAAHGHLTGQLLSQHAAVGLARAVFGPLLPGLSRRRDAEPRPVR